MIYILFFAGGWVCGEGANEVFEVPGIFYTYSTSQSGLATLQALLPTCGRRPRHWKAQSRHSYEG